MIQNMIDNFLYIIYFPFLKMPTVIYFVNSHTVLTSFDEKLIGLGIAIIFIYTLKYIENIWLKLL